MSLNETFLEAIRNRNLEKAKEYFSVGADVNFYKEGHTPLSLAINNGDMPMFKFLISTEKLLKKEIVSCIEVALYRKEKDMAQSLIAHTDEVYQPFYSTDSYIKMAIKNGWADILESMLKKGLSPKKCRDLNVPPMHYAAKQKNPAFVKILGRYIDVNDTKDEEKTPLMIAAEMGNIETMEALLRMGANPAGKQEAKIDIKFLIPSLLRAGLIKINWECIDSVIHKAVLSRKPEAIDMLLKYRSNLNLNEQGDDAKTPLMIAAEIHDEIVVHHLLKLGVDVNIRRGEGNALHSAVDGNSLEIIKLLLIYGIDQFHQSNDHKTALDKAILNNRKYGKPSQEVIDFLRYAQQNPKKVTSQKPTYFPGCDPRGGYSRND